MTERVKKMKDSLNVEKYPLCIEVFRLANESLDATVGESMVVRRAKLHKHILDNITIFIEEGDLLCGSGASKPFGMEVQYEYGVWTPDEVEALKSEIYTIDPEDEAELYELNKRFENNPLNSNLIDALSKSLGMDDRMWPFMKSGAILPPWKDRKGGSGGGYAMSGYGLGPGFYLICIDFEKIINEGAKSIIQEAKQCLAELRYTSSDSIEKKEYWESVILVFEAWVGFAKRYSKLAYDMAEKTDDPVRKAELLQMARICEKVPYEPADTFHEALQAFWFTFLLACPSPTATAGRFDQYMYPSYKRDIDAGRISREEALELLEIMRCKIMKINRVSGKANRSKNSGMAKWYNWTIGGVDKDGNDATNELTYLLLESALNTKLPHFTVTVRVHENTPDELMKKSLEVIKSGLGMPAFLGDKSYIKFFVDNGVPLSDARDYCATGCVDGNIPAKTRTQVITFFVIAQAFDIFMHNGFCRYTNEFVGIKTGDVTTFKTFEEFKNAFFRQCAHLLSLAAERNNVELIAERDLFPDPFRSALMVDGVKKGKELLNRDFVFENASLLCAVGGVNTGDSLAAVKKLVFDDKKYTMSELLNALDANWEGYELMQEDFKTAPKYGNNDDLPDNLVAEVYDFFADTCYSLDNAYGGKVVPNAISISAHQPGGLCTGATPDGRRTGEVLADASLSPTQGMDSNGTLAVLQSAMKVDQDPFQGTLLNMKFHPSALKTSEDMHKLGNVIKTYLTNGGKHIQFNVVTREEMLDAKVNPEEHPELVVRVAGYSAYFTNLSEMIQDEVIERTGFEKVQ